jgi:excisionase family DNA binding protein
MAEQRMTVAQVAAELGVSVAAVYRAISAKRLPARRRKGEGLTVTRTDLEAYRKQRDRWMRISNLVPTTKPIRVPCDPDVELGVYVRRPGALTWRRHAALPAGEGFAAVEVPAGWEVGTTERQSARIRDTDGAIRPLPADQLTLPMGDDA